MGTKGAKPYARADIVSNLNRYGVENKIEHYQRANVDPSCHPGQRIHEACFSIALTLTPSRKYVFWRYTRYVLTRTLVPLRQNPIPHVNPCDKTRKRVISLVVYRQHGMCGLYVYRI